MSFLEEIIQKDRALLVYLNSLGSSQYDAFWLQVTNKYFWIPLYLLILFLFFRYYGWKKTLVLLVITAGLVTFTDQFVNLIKNATHRLRPNMDESLQHIIRIVKNPHSYSFVSGHATNSTAVTTFVILLLSKYAKYIYLILIWPLLFAYSRIYLGIHFPLDVFSGILLGISIGFIFYFITQYLLKKTFLTGQA